MTETRFTPGPWRFVVRRRGDGDTGTIVAAVAPGHQILTDAMGGHYPSNDGRLIAASPDLYAACESALDYLLDPHGAGQHPDNPLPTMLREALARASSHR